MAVTTKQIAELAGVSRGTVDRALHNRGRVNPEVAAKIKEIADELGYRPHTAAQSLALSNREFKFGVYAQSADTPTMKIVLAGIERIREELKPFGVKIQMITHPSFDNGAIMDGIEDLMADGCQALAITPTMDKQVIDKVNQLENSGIPVVFFNRDAQESNRLCYVGMNNYKGGQVAGFLMGNILGSKGKVLPITGHLTNYAHYDRGRGFINVLQQEFPDIEILDMQGCFDSDIFAYQIAKFALEKNPDINGIFVASNGTEGVVRALRESGMQHRVKVVAFDLNEPNKQALLHDDIAIVLDQQPELQGYRAVEILYEYMAKNQIPTDRNEYCALNVYTKYNIG